MAADRYACESREREMAKKPEISLSYLIRGSLEVTIRFLGKVARLGEEGVKANWAYEIKLNGTRLFSGADLYTGTHATHAEAAAEVLWLHMPQADGVPAWFDVPNLKRNQMAWFLTDFRPFFQLVAEVSTIAAIPDAMFVRGDGSLVPMDRYGIPIDEAVFGGEEA